MSFADESSYLSQDIGEVDPEVARLLRAELERQAETLEMIASENFTSQAVLQAVGSVLTNKYAEGLPHRRYYGGCEIVDQVEELAIERAIEVFGCEHVNVQPHSGATANEAAYQAVLAPGDRVLAMALAHGGHLSHGLKVNFSGRLYEFHHYGVRREDCRIDMDQVAQMARELRPEADRRGRLGVSADHRLRRLPCDRRRGRCAVHGRHGPRRRGSWPPACTRRPIGVADIVTTTLHKSLGGPRAGMIMCRADLASAVDRAVFPGLQGGPLMHVIAGKAVALGHALTEEFRERQRQVMVNTGVLADGLLAGGVSLVTGGSDNHLVLVDLSGTELTGADAEVRLDRAGITVNKNGIPFDERPPDGDLRPADRDACAHDARAQGAGDGRDRPDHRGGAAARGLRTRELGVLRERSRAISERFPLYPRLVSGSAIA